MTIFTPHDHSPGCAGLWDFCGDITEHLAPGRRAPRSTPGSGDATLGCQELRTAVLEVEALPTDSRARLHAVRGVALLAAFKLGFRRADLDASVADLERAYTWEATGARALNLASALMERYELDGTAIDHRRALSLLQASLDDAQASAEQRARRSAALLEAMLKAVEHGLEGGDLDAAIDLGERLMADPDKEAAGRGEVENLLGAAYVLAAQRGHARADLRRMVELLHRSTARSSSCWRASCSASSACNCPR
jgi:hypothetical protein